MTAGAEFSISPVRRSLPQYNPAKITELLRGGPGLRLHIRESVLSGMRRHASNHPDEEVGGVLLGRHYESDGSYAAVVTDHLAVQSENKGAMHFEFDQRSIAMILGRLEGSADYVVGWYHSHIIGPPFMSMIDYNNHHAHFPLPWYVSCVIAGGEWGLPVDFWHLVDGELVNIREYALDMDSTETATDAHHQFLRACLLDESSPHTTASYISDVLAELGLPANGVIEQLLHSAPSSDAATRLGELRFIIDLAAGLASDPQVRGEIESVRERLTLARSYEKRLSRVLISDQLREQFAFCLNRGIAVTPGDSTINWFDLSLNITFPITMDPPLAAGSFSADGAAWLLTGDKSVIKIIPDRISEETQRPLFHTNIFGIPRLQGEARQVAADENDLWIMTSECWYRVPVGPEQPRTRLGQILELPTADTCLLLDGLTSHHSPVRLLTRRGPSVQAWGLDGDAVVKVAEHVLPEPWSEWQLTHACSGAVGLYLLFNDGVNGQLGLFDRKSLTLTTHFLNDISDVGITPPSEVCADPFGRVSVRCGTVLCRLRP
jgi:proteasome lid subunit RPN8/RPN11